MSEIPHPVPHAAPPSGHGPAAEAKIKPVATWGSQSIFDRPDERKLGRSVFGSMILHGVLFSLIFFVMFKSVESKIETPEKLDLVFLEQPGPGGGGGGSPTPAPPKPAEIPKPKPAETPIPQEIVKPEPIPELTAPVMTNAANLVQANGLSSLSLAAFGGGGTGHGIGSGHGDGVGPGEGTGFGGGIARPGSGCINPSPIRQANPNYTSDAMRAKLQGDVEVDAIVLANGTVGDVKITKSLDTQWGLDQEAIKAAKAWLFKPATCNGVKVPMVVGLIIEFRLH